MSESFALARARVRRRPPKPPGSPSPWPWWFTALMALLNLLVTIQALIVEHNIVWAAFQGALFLLTGNWAVVDWQWHRYNRWKGGR
jgi:hypothetical protein